MKKQLFQIVSKNFTSLKSITLALSLISLAQCTNQLEKTEDVFNSNSDKSESAQLDSKISFGIVLKKEQKIGNPTIDLVSIIDDTERSFLKEYKLSKEELEALENTGMDGGVLKTFEILDKKTNKKYIEFEIDGDIRMLKNQLLELSEKAKKNKNAKIKQYRTTNLVTNNRVYNVYGINLQLYSPLISQALIEAVANYNNLNLGIRFNLIFDTILSQADMWKWYRSGIKVSLDTQPGFAGGYAGTPNANGDPYSFVKIYLDTQNSGLNICRHVLTHEIGHCIGFRHTDYFNRSISCNTGGDEGAAGVGAVQIAGTPGSTNIDMSSVYLSCFNGTESGLLSNLDIVSLNTLYPRP